MALFELIIGLAIGFVVGHVIARQIAGRVRETSSSAPTNTAEAATD